MRTTTTRICTVAVLGLGLALAPAVTATATPTTPTTSEAQASTLKPVSNVGLASATQLTGSGVTGARVSVVDATGKTTEVSVAKPGKWTTSVKGFTAPLSITQSRLGVTSKVTTFGAQQVSNVRLVRGAVVGTGTPAAVVILRDAQGERRTATVDRSGSWTVPSAGLVAKLQIRERLLSQTSKPVAFGSRPQPVEVSYRSGDHLIGSGAEHAVVTIDDARGKTVTGTVDYGRWDIDIKGLVGPLALHQTLLGLDSAETVYGERPAAPEVSYRSGDHLIGSGAEDAIVTIDDARGKTVTGTVDYGRWDIDINGLVGPLAIHQTLLGIDSEDTVYGERPAAPEVSYRSGDHLIGSGAGWATVTATDANGVTVTSDVSVGRWAIDLRGLVGPLAIHQTVLGIDSEDTVYGERPAAPEVSYRAGDRLVGSGAEHAVVTVTDGTGASATGTVEYGRWVVDVRALRGPVSVHQTLLGIDSEETVFAG